MGGCHVVGWPQSKARPFPTLLSELVGAKVVGQVPHLRISHLAEGLASVHALRPTHAVFQLGNYEFTGYLKSLVHQYNHLFDTRLVEETLGHYAEKAPAEAAGTGAPLGRRGGLGPAHYARVGAAGALVTGLWLFSRQYRASFRNLAACARQHPGTSFIFLSPLPCLTPADNAMRRFGGWLLRRRLPALPNVHWLDAHQLLGAEPALFVDAAHLNQRAHQALAYGLAAAVLGHADGCFKEKVRAGGPTFTARYLLPRPLGNPARSPTLVAH
ncbi:hypothetical protein AXW84_02025 [Hymenobacter sp. PAMC 26628]|nr:hypothetical protein AXW84_02025 [Hymenobacter sp. PAMC 26628]